MGKSPLGWTSEIGGVVGNADHSQACRDTGFNIIPDVSVSMAAAEMVGMQVEFHG
ncbi:hypothetical protein D3C76_1821910 [compost metagenome]